MKYLYKRLDKSQITEQMFKQIFDVENSEGDGYTEEQLREIWLNDPKDDNFVCMHGENIVGHISLNPLSKRRNGSIFVVNLVVAPEYRRQGIAQNLIQTACKYYLEKGESLPMSITVDKDNIPAVKLYIKVGFEIREPICKIDEDDTQYILDNSLECINQKIDDILGKNYCQEN